MNIFQNKSLLIHISCEIIIIALSYYWINKKNKHLLNEINMLRDKLYQQDKIIKQHTQLINQLFEIKNENIILNNPIVKNDNTEQSLKVKNIDEQKESSYKDIETESQLDNKIFNELKELEEEEEQNK